MEQSVPKWFDGEIYEHGDVVENAFTGERISLNNVELSLYDLLMGSAILAESVTDNTTKENLYKTVDKVSDWFLKNNPHAYMVLID